MPKNPFIYWGLMIVVGAGAIWAGHWLALRIVWAVPYAIGVGIGSIALGIFLEVRKRNAAQAPTAELPVGVSAPAATGDAEQVKTQ